MRPSVDPGVGVSNWDTGRFEELGPEGASIRPCGRGDMPGRGINREASLADEAMQSARGDRSLGLSVEIYPGLFFHCVPPDFGAYDLG